MAHFWLYKTKRQGHMNTIGDDLYHVEMSPDKHRETPQKAIELYLPALVHKYSVLPIYMPTWR